MPDVEGWELVPLPGGSDTQGGWEVNALKKQFWRGKRLAHIFDDEWSTGTYQKDEMEDGNWHFIFYFSLRDLGIRYYFGLLLEEHGLTKSWVVIEKSKKPA